MKKFVGIDSMEIGINLWLVPQISEHCPKYRPGELHKKFTWFSRPGTASALIPSAGIVHEWSTSAAVIKFRICIFIGITILLSTSSNRKLFIVLDEFMYESNSCWLKSEYSYDQYHWWPIVLIVKLGVKTSSNIYRSLIDGIPIKMRIKEGEIVQNNSNCCDSIINLFGVIYIVIEINE